MIKIYNTYAFSLIIYLYQQSLKDFISYFNSDINLYNALMSVIRRRRDTMLLA